MKPSLLLTLLLLSPHHANAEQRSWSDIKTLAATTLASHGIAVHTPGAAKTPAAVAPSSEEETATPVADELQMLYNLDHLVVVGRPDGGYAIISKDDTQDPILGYSDSPFDSDDIAPAFLYLLERTNRSLASAPSSYKAGKAAARRRAIRYAEIPQAVEPLIKTKWNQGRPFNYWTPVIDGQNCVTGCVATAWAQVVKYYGTPTHATGMKYVQDEGYWTDFSSIVWDFDLMPEGRVTSWSYDESVSLSSLMYVMGMINNATYGLSTTCAWAHDPAMDDFMGYTIEDVELSTATFMQHVAEGTPVLYCAETESGSMSHMMIIDGYDSEGLVHVNFGWGGYNDGYVVLTDRYDMDYYTESQEALVVSTIQRTDIGGVTYGYNPMTGRAAIVGPQLTDDGNFLTPDITIEPAITVDGTEYTISKMEMNRQEINRTYTPQGLNSVTIGRGFDEIPERTFYGVTFNELHLPNTIKSIGNYAFYYTYLSHVYCDAITPPSLAENSFGWAERDATLHVPAVALDAYQADEAWAGFFKHIVALDAVEQDAADTPDDPTSHPIDRPDDVPTRLVVWKTEGSHLVYLLNDQPICTIEGNTLHIDSQNYTAEHDMLTVDKLTYVVTEDELIPVGIEWPAPARFAADGESLLFHAADSPLDVSIISTAGIVLQHFVVGSHGSQTFSLASLMPGTYIISVNGKTSKIYCK